MVDKLKFWWGHLGSHPLGRWLFSKILSRLIPYTGTISPEVLALSPGVAQVQISDRRIKRNHLSSIHALALANLGELSTGLALHFALPAQGQAILTKLEVEYHKKARGPIRAEVRLKPGEPLKGPVLVKAELLNEAGQLVCTVRATWLIRELSS